MISPAAYRLTPAAVSRSKASLPSAWCGSGHRPRPWYSARAWATAWSRESSAARPGPARSVPCWRTPERRSRQPTTDGSTVGRRDRGAPGQEQGRRAEGQERRTGWTWGHRVSDDARTIWAAGPVGRSDGTGPDRRPATPPDGTGHDRTTVRRTGAVRRCRSRETGVRCGSARLEQGAHDVCHPTRRATWSGPLQTGSGRSAPRPAEPSRTCRSPGRPDGDRRRADESGGARRRRPRLVFRDVPLRCASPAPGRRRIASTSRRR